MKKLLALSFAAFLAACSEADITGTWVQPIPGAENELQGFILSPDGTATTVNAETILYSTWSRNGDILTLTGQSLGNRQTIDFTQDYEIEKLTSDTLIIRNGDMLFEYTRQ